MISHFIPQAIVILTFVFSGSADIKLIRSTATTLEWNMADVLQPGKKYSVEVLYHAPTGKVRVIDEPLSPKEKTYKAFNLKSNKLYQLKVYPLGKKGQGLEVLSQLSNTNLRCYSCNGAISADYCTDMVECSPNQRQCFTRVRYFNGNRGRFAIYKGCKVSTDVCLPNHERMALTRRANSKTGNITTEQALETMPGLKFFGDVEKLLEKSPSILKRVKKKFAEKKKLDLENTLKKQCSHREDPESFCRCCCNEERCNHALLDCGITPPPDFREEEPLPPDIATTRPEKTFPTLAPRKIAPVCRDFNGGCDHVCIPLNKTTVRCDCHTDYKLQEDGKTCKTHLLHAVADAGPDITITLPQNSITLTANRTKGAVKRYKWWDPIAIGEGTGLTISASTDAQLRVTNLRAGQYKFILMVTGMDGRRTSDVMTLTVKPNPLTLQATAKPKRRPKPRVGVLSFNRYRSLRHRKVWKTHVKENGITTEAPSTRPRLQFSSTPRSYTVVRRKGGRKTTTTTTTTAATTTTVAPKRPPSKPGIRGRGKGPPKKLPPKGRGKGKPPARRVGRPNGVKPKGPAKLRMANRESQPNRTPVKRPLGPKTRTPVRRPIGPTKRTPIKNPLVTTKVEPTLKPKTPAKTPRKPTAKPKTPAKTPRKPTAKPKTPAKTARKPAAKPKTPARTPQKRPMKRVPVNGKRKPKTPLKRPGFAKRPVPVKTKQPQLPGRTTPKPKTTQTPSTTTSTSTTTTTENESEPVVCPALGNLVERKVVSTCSESNVEGSKCSFVCEDGRTLQGGSTSVTCGRLNDGAKWMSGAGPAVLPCCELACPANAHADVIFLIHSSTAVGRADWTKVLNFVNSMVNDYTFGEDNVCVGAVRYHRAPDFRSEIGLDCSRTKEAFKQALLKLPFAGSGSGTGAALNHLRTKSFKSPNNRPNAKDVAVIITDSRSTDDVTRAARALKTTGVKIQVMGIKTRGGSPNMIQMKAMASFPAKVVNIPRIPAAVPPAAKLQFRGMVCAKGCERYKSGTDKSVARPKMAQG